MTQDEVKRLPGDECIILLGGQKPIIAKKLSKLEECMNYDIYKKIGNYNVEEEKNTQKTYYEGRLKSEAIQAVLEADKRIEHARRLGIKEVDLKFEQGDLTKEVRATSSIPAETTFAGKTVEDIKPEIKVYNWREEFDDPEKIENEAAREFKYPLYIIMVSGAAELALYYIRNFETTSIFLPLGTMGFIVSLIWIQVYRYYDQYVQKQKIAYLQKMANMDMLTEAMNRNAYENMIKYLDEQEIELRTTGVVLCIT